jgi:hypothetical protein
MLQREEILQSWNRYSATAYRSPQFLKAQQFFDMVRARTDLCWDDLATEFRKNYYDAFEPVVNVLMATNDPMVMHNAVRLADLSNPQEANAAKVFIRNSDPTVHQVTLAALAATPEMRTELLKKPQLPDSVRASLGLGNQPAPPGPPAPPSPPAPAH